MGTTTKLYLIVVLEPQSKVEYSEMQGRSGPVRAEGLYGARDYYVEAFDAEAAQDKLIDDLELSIGTELLVLDAPIAAEARFKVARVAEAIR